MCPSASIWLGHSMRLFFELSLFPELIRWVDTALVQIDGGLRRPRRRGSGWQRTFYIDSLAHPVAAAAAIRAVDLYRGLADKQALGRCANARRRALVGPGNTVEGEAMLREARSLLQPLGSSKYLGECLDLTGMCLESTGLPNCWEDSC